ncbi:ABC transporter permease [Rhodobacteraceae bacterium RKSG542]|uniref:ABC transporter permease n=1 Tax=Pseudovibrio flavus TaxID=2529854 RepID=UPI0012BD1285|nr:ABC transporter permease [Pseudovibrio flavus]MTI17360.1 ABC transporter permease [Pseudovibrio flavus]
MTKSQQRWVFSFVTPFALIGLWWAYVELLNVPRFILPSPLVVAEELVKLFSGSVKHAGKTLWQHLGYTLSIIATGFAIGSASGFGLGFILAKMPKVEKIVSPYIFFFQTAPKIALAPLFILWFGLGLASKLVLVVSLVFFPVMIGTMLGLRSVPENMISLSRILKLTTYQRLTRIELPSAVPEIFAGLKVASVQATIGAILAEWLSGSIGLGYLMTYAGATYKSPLLFSMVIVTALLGILIYQFLGTLERWLLSWR